MTGPAPPSWLDGLAMHLASAGHGTYRADENYTPGDPWPFFVERMPPEPDRCIALFSTGGTQAAHDAEPRAQLRIRGDLDPRTSRRHAEALWRHLHFLAGGVLLDDGTWLVNAPGINGGVVYVAPDENGRHEHTTNHQLTTSLPSQP